MNEFLRRRVIVQKAVLKILLECWKKMQMIQTMRQTIQTVIRLVV